jgi:glucan 1,3-beta-glucosidase
MQALFNAASLSGNVVYFDHGAYLVSSTVNVPANAKITGELLSIIMATGPFFSDQNNPQPMWKIGSPGELGTVEISDLVFETKGPCPGAIIIEWNIAADGPAAAGIWDAHWRIGDSAGTQLQSDTCFKNPGVTTTLASAQAFIGAFALLHVTPQANGYFESWWG